MLFFEESREQRHKPKKNILMNKKTKSKGRGQCASKKSDTLFPKPTCAEELRLAFFSERLTDEQAAKLCQDFSGIGISPETAVKFCEMIDSMSLDLADAQDFFGLRLEHLRIDMDEAFNLVVHARDCGLIPDADGLEGLWSFAQEHGMSSEDIKTMLWCIQTLGANSSLQHEELWEFLVSEAELTTA
jgi:hypothetical protein